MRFRASFVIISIMSYPAFAEPVYQLPAVAAFAAPPFSYQQTAATGNQVIISSSQIARSGANNLGQVINNIAGVQYIAGLGAAPQILLHSEPALIMLNGRPLTNFSMAEPDIGLVPLSEIQEIVIMPGVAGSLYGDQSLGGVINIITKTGATPENNVNLAVGSPFMRQETGTSAGSLSNSVTYRADYQNEYDSGYRSSSSQTSNHLGLTFTKTYSDGSVSLDLLGLRQFIDFPGALTQAEEQQDRSQAGDYVSTYFANTGLAALDWQQQFNAGWHSDTALSYRTQAASVFGGTDNQNYGTAQLNPQVYGKFTLWQRPIGVNLGMLLSIETYDYTGSIQDANQQQFGLNAGLSIPISPKLTGSVDARTVAVDTAGTFINTGSYPYQFNPPSSQTQHINLLSLGLEDQLNAATQVYLRRAMGYQLPFIDESSNSPYPSTGFGLQATTSTEYETGVNWQGARLKLTAEAFINELNNEIGYYSPNNNPYGGYNYNMDPTEREGVSLDGQYQASLQWTLGASGTLMNNRFRAGPDAGNQIPGSSNLLANVNARYQFNPIWSVYTEAQYTGAQYAEGDNANVSSEMPGYWLLNAALNAEFNAWLWNFRIDNITNTQYNLATVYFTTTNSVGYYPAPGRSYLLSVNYKFH